MTYQYVLKLLYYYANAIQVPQSTLESISKSLFINELSDWYNVPYAHLKSAKAQGILDVLKKYLCSYSSFLYLNVKRYSSIESFVQAEYPNHEWDISKFGKVKFGPQNFLERVVRSIFPEQTIERNVRSGLGLVGSKGKHLEIDVYLPDLKLGFEYQV